MIIEKSSAPMQVGGRSSGNPCESSRLGTVDPRRVRTARRMLAASAAIAMLCAMSGVAHAEQLEPAQCSATAFDIPGGTMGATLCVPPQPADTVLVLIPGASINQSYWDTSYQPETYNFRRAMNSAGHATLTVDRLGTGTSSRPPSTAVTSTGQAAGIHQIVSELRAGLPGVRPSAKIVVGGISLGAGIAILEASAYRDVDGVFLSGYSHHLDIPGTLSTALTFVPAALDPRFAEKSYDLGYLTTAPGTRTASFLAAETPAEIRDIAEQSADVLTVTELLDGLPTAATALTTQIDVPVLLVNGSADKLCAPDVCTDTHSLHSTEAPFFAPGQLSTYVLPGAGHAINLAPNTTDYHAVVADWLANSISETR